MASTFPDAQPTLTNPVSTDLLNSTSVPHATQHADANDLIEAIALKVGTDTVSGADGGVLFYSSASSGFSQSTRLHWDIGSSQLGIGTTAPDRSLDIVGTLQVTSTATLAGLSATTGTFSGGISATTGTFTGGVIGTTGAFSGGVSGTTGTFTGGLILSGRFDQAGFATFTTGDTTPSVSGGNHFKTANTAGTTITAFDGVADAQTFYVRVGDTNTVFAHSTSLQLQGGVNSTVGDGDVYTFVTDSVDVFEVSRSTR